MKDNHELNVVYTKFLLLEELLNFCYIFLHTAMVVANSGHENRGHATSPGKKER
jgi:hypothetical protein